MPAQTVIKIRRDTSTNWSSVDPTLGAGEIAFETDTNKIKVGDGLTAWSSLDYASGAGTAAEITYDNTDAALIASNVKAALDELSLGKADISQLSTNLAVYATTGTSDISGYSVLVSSMDDADYDDTAVNVATGAINADDQLIASLAAPAGLFEGHVDAITVTTIGNIRKTAGNNNQSASFYFEVYVRNAAGTETLVGTSGDTGEVNPPDLNVYQRFSASALVQFGDVIDTDRVVIKYYGNVADGAGANYDFQFGGTEPVRTLIPVPANVVVVHEASGVIVDTSNFDGILSGSDATVQAALETIDDFVVPPGTTASDSAPSSPEVGQMWWDSTDGTLYIYYDGFWVESTTGVVGPQGDPGIEAGATAPTDTSLLWLDTTEDGDMVVPSGGTTGQVLAKATGDDYDTEWATKADVPLSTVTTAGDLIVADGASSVTRLGVGTDDQILTVVSGEPAWADAAGGGGAWTLLRQAALAADSTFIFDASAFVGDGYRNLRLVISGGEVPYGTKPYLQIRFTGGGSIQQRWVEFKGNALLHQSGTEFYIPNQDEGLASNAFSYTLDIIDYQRLSSKTFLGYGGGNISTGGAARGFMHSGTLVTTSVIGDIVLSLPGGTWQGGAAYLYGEK